MSFIKYKPVHWIFGIKEQTARFQSVNKPQFCIIVYKRVLYFFKIFPYERIMVASLDYAIKNNIKKVQYSLVDNYTKLRLVNALEPCGLFFYSKNPMNRFVFNKTHKIGDVFKLYSLEKQGLLKYGTKWAKIDHSHKATTGCENC